MQDWGIISGTQYSAWSDGDLHLETNSRYPEVAIRGSEAVLIYEGRRFPAPEFVSLAELVNQYSEFDNDY
jgi:hypothetical protein